MRKIAFLLLLIPMLLASNIMFGQNIAITDSAEYNAKSSAMLDVQSNSKGLLIPRLTSAQRTGISTPETGLLVYDSDLDVFYYYDGSGWVNISKSQVWEVNSGYVYLTSETNNVGIGTSTPNSKLEVRADDSFTVDDTLFCVKDKNGNVVFAVFPDGAAVYVNEGAKGKVGGFAVSGRIPSKAGDVDILRVTPDSTRIYVNEDTLGKGKVGGFAVSGRIPSKGVVNDYLQVTRDSTRIYITESTTKGKVGGFAISGRIPSKEVVEKDYFNISANTTAEKISNESRIMWYPEKSAFMAGEVHVGSADSVGTNSTSLGYRNIAKGNWSQAFGFQSKALGDYSTAIGNEAEAETNSLAVGYLAKAEGNSSFAMGYGALASGDNSYALGSVGLDSAGVVTNSTQSIGEYSFAFGLGSVSSGKGSVAFGTGNTALGEYSTAIGYKNQSNNWYTTALGGYAEATGIFSTAIGFKTEASGFAATSNGIYTKSSGDYSYTAGYSNDAIGISSVALGNNTQATGDESFSMGMGSISSGDYSVTFGFETEAAGAYSLALGNVSTVTSTGAYAIAGGYNTTASGVGSTTLGSSTTASGYFATTLGYNTEASSYAAFVIGRYNDDTGIQSTWWSSSEPLFIAGNGGSDVSRANALILFKNGNMTIAGILTESSDKRLKENIVNMEDVLSNVLSINPVYFEFKNKETHPSGRHIGFIAQEIEPLFPELIEKDSKGFLSLEYANMTAVLLQAIKEQQEIIEQHELENKKLQKQIEDINQKLEKLEQIILNK